MNYKKKMFMSFCIMFSITVFSAPVIERSSWKGKIVSKNINIKNLYGDIRLRDGEASDEIEYFYVIQHLEKSGKLKVIHSKNNGIFDIEVKKIKIKDETIDIDKARVDLVVFVPKGLKLNVQTFDGLVEVKGLKSEVNVLTASGLIVLNGVKGVINTKNNTGKTEVTIKELQFDKSISLESVTGDISLWIDVKSNFEVEMNTSSDIITDYTIKMTKFKNKEPRKRGVVRLNGSKSKINLFTKRGVLALRDFE